MLFILQMNTYLGLETWFCFLPPPLSLTHIQHSDLKGVKVGELEIIQERLNIKKDRETVLVNAHKVQGRKDGLFFFSCGRIGLRMKRSGIDPPLSLYPILLWLVRKWLKGIMIRMTIKDDVKYQKETKSGSFKRSKKALVGVIYSLSFIMTLISFTKYVLLIFGSWKERTQSMFRRIDSERDDSKITLLFLSK